MAGAPVRFRDFACLINQNSYRDHDAVGAFPISYQGWKVDHGPPHPFSPLPKRVDLQESPRDEYKHIDLKKKRHAKVGRINSQSDGRKVQQELSSGPGTNQSTKWLCKQKHMPGAACHMKQQTVLPFSSRHWTSTVVHSSNRDNPKLRDTQSCQTIPKCRRWWTVTGK